MEGSLEERKSKILQYLKNKPVALMWVVFGLIAAFGYYIRTRNLRFLIDVTTNDYMPSDPDAVGFLRYVKYILAHGHLMDVDYMRYFPTGFTGLDEFSLNAHLIADFYKIYHFFVPSVTVGYADIIYPAFAFVIALVFFFLFVKKVFDWKVALLSSAFLTVLPAYLYRTMSGVSDKEAMAMIFFYLALYAFISFILEKKLWMGVFFSVLAGVATALLWWIWGGYIFVTVSTSVFILILSLVGRLRSREMWLYVLYFFSAYFVLLIGFPERANILGLLAGPTTAIFLFSFVFVLGDYFLFTRDIFKVKSKIGKIPHALVTLAFLCGIGFIFILVAYGFTFIPDRIFNLYQTLVQPFAANRWALTVAESHQPYFLDWVGPFTWKFLLMAFAGSLFVVYGLVKPLGKKGYPLLVSYGVLVLAVALNRYSSSSTFNGESNISLFVYLGALIIIPLYVLYYLYTLHRNDKEFYVHYIHNLPLGYLFVSVFFVFLLIGARSAVRLLFVFSPIVAIFVAYFVFALIDELRVHADKRTVYAVSILLAIIVLILLNSFTQSSLAQAESTGSSYSPQWQYAMSWVRNNTPEDAVFAHWWDYGYFVQTGGERATISDGGNAVSSINYFVGRHLLTAANDTEALEFLASKNVTHVLVISDEIGKYSAFSSIGADAHYDRFSWISAFTLDQAQSQQTENLTTMTYTGGVALDDDFVYQGQLFPARQTGIIGFTVPFDTIGNATVTGVEQPTVYLAYNGQGYKVPLRCLFYNGKEVVFDNGSEALEGCLQIIPVIQGGQVSSVGAAMYLSHDVWNTWFTKYYLFSKTSPEFTLVYSDEQSVPLSIYNGRIIGPIKIWEVAYPSNLSIPAEYYENTVPEGVNTVDPSFGMG
ncbi:hypothetical protein HZA98_02960 [Candidatus Woesearchaeota archaeon]|nr:hypothetical protein [Candidatus Woesearchaeota archaeon]